MKMSMNVTIKANEIRFCNLFTHAGRRRRIAPVAAPMPPPVVWATFGILENLHQGSAESGAGQQAQGGSSITLSHTRQMLFS